MGFIVVGHGYKRRQVRARPSDPVAPWRKTPKSSRSTTSSQGHRIPQTSTDLREPVNLQDIPVEILYKIFALAGYGEQNQLHLTCKSLLQELSSSNPWLLRMVARYNCLVDLNGSFEVSSEAWLQNFLDLQQTLLQPLRERYRLDSLFHAPREMIETRIALDSSIFSLKCVDVNNIRNLCELNHQIVCGSESIQEQVENRERYLQWRFMVLEEFIQNAKEAEDADVPPTAEQLLSTAESVQKCVEFRDKYNLASFVPITSNTKISEAMFAPITETLVRKILALHEYSHMEFENPVRFVAAVLVHQIPLSEELAESLLSIIDVDTVSSNEILSLLTAYKNCQDILLQLPLEQRLSHHLQSLIDGLHGTVKTCLTSYHESPSDSRLKDGPMWELLYQIQSSELIDHVVSMGGMPTCDLL